MFQNEKYVDARLLFERAAAKGLCEAKCMLGIIHAGGLGTPADGQVALKWYAEALECGNLDALNNMGLVYELGKGGVTIDYQKAEECYKEAIGKGFMLSKYNLGVLYYNCRRYDKEPQKSYAEIMKLFLEVAAETEIESRYLGMYMVGEMYIKGYGVEQDFEEAREWFRRAKDAGSPQSVRDMELQALRNSQ